MLTNRDMSDDGTGVSRRLPVGAERVQGGVHFRVWAPVCRRIDVVVGADDAEHALAPEPDGWFAGRVDGIGAGTRYRFRLDRSQDLLADPASRFQPHGPNGPSEVIDPDAFAWTDDRWPGTTLVGRVITEVHVGTFTQEGTWAAATEKIPLLADTGIDLIELMPVADFPGAFGWGYDGVALFAPTRLYGRPDDMRRFVDAAHASGIGVILDVVYNHLGPDGNVLPRYSDRFFREDLATDWGAAIDFSGPHAGPVREFYLANVEYWIREFHLDGFRFDATQDIHDDSDVHILTELTQRARSTARPRSIVLVGENEPQRVWLITPAERGGGGLDALWNDDFHHSSVVALTGRREAYYTDYFGNSQELVSAAKHGFLYQGQRYAWQGKRRGTPTRGIPRSALVHFLENHDQLANSSAGERIRLQTSPGQYRALTAFVMLGPATPFLFQGQEFGATTPFRYFADHRPELARLVVEGRAEFLRQFRSLALPKLQRRLPDPGARATFEASKLDWSEREANSHLLALHRDLIALRRSDPVFSEQGRYGMDGAVLGPDAFVLRWFDAGDDDRLLVVNLGRDLNFSPAPEPLLAPPADALWRILWSSSEPEYGGAGTPPLDDEKQGWRIPAQCAVALAPNRDGEGHG